jgi:hypothetical protein
MKMNVLEALKLKGLPIVADSSPSMELWLLLLVIFLIFFSAFLACYLKVGFRFVHLENEHASRIVMGEERVREIYRGLLARGDPEPLQGTA